MAWGCQQPEPAVVVPHIGYAPTSPPTSSPTPTAPPASPGPTTWRLVASYDLPSDMAAMTVAPDGAIWLLLQEGVATLPKGASQPTLTPINHDATANQILVDAHGDVWINKYFPGVDRFAQDGTRLATCAVPGADFAAIPFVIDRDGDVWTGPTKCKPDGTVQFTNPYAGAQFLAANGQIVGRAQFNIFWLAPSGQIDAQVDVKGQLSTFGLDGDDKVWAYDQAGKALLRAERTRVEVVQQGLPADIRTMRTDSRGQVLALDADFNLYRLGKAGEGEPLTTLPADTFFLDPQDRAWIAHGKQAQVYEAPTPPDKPTK